MECGYGAECGYFCVDFGGGEFGCGVPKKLHVFHEGADNGGHVHPDLHSLRGVFLLGLLPLQFQPKFCFLLRDLRFHVHLGHNNNCGHSNSLDSEPNGEIKEIVVHSDIHVERDEKNKHERKYVENIDDIEYV